MKKIPSVFVRDFERDPRFVRPELTPGCEWVLNNEGVATRKRDGTACMVDERGCLWRRYDAKGGKAPPPGFMPAQDPDQKTGHWPGWIPVGDGPQDQHYFAAKWPQEHGTYELCGPKFQSNAENLLCHEFFKHGAEPIAVPLLSSDPTEAFAQIREILSAEKIEGIVWHHADGRMAKLKRSDYGLDWQPKRERVAATAPRT